MMNIIPHAILLIQVHSFLITNLAVGDFLMGLYLILVAAVDVHYRGVYR